MFNWYESRPKLYFYRRRESADVQPPEDPEDIINYEEKRDNAWGFPHERNVVIRDVYEQRWNYEIQLKHKAEFNRAMKEE